jgi:hypothetical protein
MKHAIDNGHARPEKSASETKSVGQESVREARRAPTALEIALRLANIEAILTQLLQQRRAKARTGTKRTQSMRVRVRNEALAHPERPQERHYRMVRELMSRR